MLSKTKKIIILSGMAVLLVATGFFNVWLNNRETPVKGEVITGNFFTTYRAEREITRSHMLLYYNSILDSAASSAEAKASAEAQLEALALSFETERVLEGEIKGLGYADCVISASTGYVNIFVQTNGMLEASEVAQILYSAMLNTGKPATSVRIIPVDSENLL